MVEYIDICDENGNWIKDENGKVLALPRSEVHKKGLFHKVVHVWIVDCNGMVLIQKRTASKESNPSKWDISCAGHIEAGMSSKETAIKELAEELGLLFSENTLELLFTCKQCCILNEGKYIDNELPDVYLITLGKPFDLNRLKLQVEEVADAKLIHHAELYELEKLLDPAFVPLFNKELYNSFDDSPYVKLFQVLSERFPITDKVDVNDIINN